MEDLELMVFVPIAGICFLVGAGLKAINNELLNKFIPFLCGIVGGIVSVIAFNTIPNFIPADNWLMALYIGIGSGLMSTGAHQIYKQFSEVSEKGTIIAIDDDKDEDETPDEPETNTEPEIEVPDDPELDDTDVVDDEV